MKKRGSRSPRSLRGRRAERYLRRAYGLPGAGALHRGGVDQRQVVVVAGAAQGKDVDHRLDLPYQSIAATMEARAPGRVRKEMTQALGGESRKPLAGADPRDRLGDAEGDDLRGGQSATGVLLACEQEIVGGAEHRSEQRVEAGRVGPRSSVHPV